MKRFEATVYTDKLRGARVERIEDLFEDGHGHHLGLRIVFSNGLTWTMFAAGMLEVPNLILVHDLK